MSEARTDTTQARPQGAAANQAEAVGSGKHRGGAAASEDTASPVHGRHRRPAKNEAA